MRSHCRSKRAQRPILVRSGPLAAGGHDWHHQHCRKNRAGCPALPDLRDGGSILKSGMMLCIAHARSGWGPVIREKMLLMCLQFGNSCI